MYDSDISLLCVISDKDRRKKVMDILEKQKTLFCLTCLGKGTANSKILNYLGLGESDKAVFFSMLSTDLANQTMKSLDEALLISKPGHGISFITRIHLGCYHKPVEFVSKENEGMTLEKDSAYNLIIVVLNRGYSEEVMEAARTAGATGGTVINARSCSIAGMEKFFGIVIAPEKEMLMIIAEDGVTAGIMTGIAEKTGPASDAGAVSFSIPVNGVRGITDVKVK